MWFSGFEGRILGVRVYQGVTTNTCYWSRVLPLGQSSVLGVGDRTHEKCLYSEFQTPTTPRVICPQGVIQY